MSNCQFSVNNDLHLTVRPSLRTKVAINIFNSLTSDFVLYERNKVVYEFGAT